MSRAVTGLLTGYFVLLFGFVPLRITPAKEHPPRAQAKGDVMQIAAALHQYYAEYGKYPIDGDQTVGEGRKQHNSAIFNVLRGHPVGLNADDHLNPRKILFFEGTNVLDPAHPRCGFAASDEIAPELKGSYFDPWGREYMIRVCRDDSRPFVMPDGSRLKARLIVWSLGKDGLQGTADDIVSWK